MTFDEVLELVQELLQRERRVAYRILKRQFALNDEDLEDLKADLIDAKRVAIDEDGKVFVWAEKAGERGAKSVERERELEERGAESEKRTGKVEQEPNLASRSTSCVPRSTSGSRASSTHRHVL